MKLLKGALLWCALLAVLGRAAVGKITHRTIERNDDPLVQLEVPFGFEAGGFIGLKIENFRLRDGFRDYSNSEALGFLLSPVDRKQELFSSVNPTPCYLDNEDLSQVLFRFDKEQLKNLVEGKDVVQDVSAIVEKKGLYALYFANCSPPPGLPVSYKIRVEMYNTYKTATGERKDYISVGEQELPMLYFLMFLFFTGVGAVWLYICFREKESVQKIHYLMFVLVCLRALTLFTEAGMYHFDRIGGNPDGWNVAFYVFTFFRGVMFFTVIVLIGTGWSYLRPFIGDQEKKILVAVIPLQVFANIAIVILDETSPAQSSWFSWQDMFHFVDIICCCAILFPIVWSIKHLRAGAETDGKAAANVEKLTLFRQFYIMVVLYIYFTRIIVYMFETFLPYDLKWTGMMASELGTLVFYVFTGMKFRPHAENEYFKLES